MQRCEIQLQGFDDKVDRLILAICQRTGVAETVHMSLPTFFETDRVTVPQFLLPIKPGETMTVSVYGVTSEKSGQFPSFSEVLVSGVCTVQSGKITFVIIKRQSSKSKQFPPSFLFAKQTLT